jgi:hypothetical protein
MMDCPMPFKSMTAFAVFSNAVIGNLQGPALKMCFLMTKKYY